MSKVMFAVAVATALFCSSIALAQDDAAKKMKMEDKPMELMSVTCEPACGFAIQSHDEAELISMVQMHAKKAHNKEMSEADVRKMMKEGGMDHMMMEKKEMKKD